MTVCCRARCGYVRDAVLHRVVGNIGDVVKQKMTGKFEGFT